MYSISDDYMFLMTFCKDKMFYEINQQKDKQGPGLILLF